MTVDTSGAAAAGYRPGTGFKRCWNCEHFTLPTPAPEQAEQPASAPADDRPTPLCTALEVAVEPTAVCDRWTQMADRARKRTGFRSALRQHGSFLWDDEAEGGKGGSGRGGPPTAGGGGTPGPGGDGGPVGL